MPDPASPGPTTRFQIARGSRATTRAATAVIVALLAIPATVALFWLPSGPVTFEASIDGLRIKGDPYGRLIRYEDLKLDGFRRLDLAAEPAFTLTRRTDGTGLPGYQSGWFYTRGAGMALVFVADWTKAVVLPTKLGYTLILGPEDPRSLIEFLKLQPSHPVALPLGTADPAGDGTPPGVWWLRAVRFGVPLLVAVPLAAIGFATRRVVFEVSPDALRIRGDLYGRRIPRAMLVLDEARLVDLATGPDHLALIRTNGVGLPGFLSGWCRAFRHEGKFLVFLTERTRVVRIPTTEGYTLLLSPAAPESFLRALGTPVPA
jgi:hypothetical protein